MVKLMRDEPRPSVIVRKPYPANMTPEEHQRRGDAADELIREMNHWVHGDG
jgi:hypothetical protein